MYIIYITPPLSYHFLSGRWTLLVNILQLVVKISNHNENTPPLLLTLPLLQVSQTIFQKENFYHIFLGDQDQPAGRKPRPGGAQEENTDP